MITAGLDAFFSRNASVVVTGSVAFDKSRLNATASVSAGKVAATLCAYYSRGRVKAAFEYARRPIVVRCRQLGWALLLGDDYDKERRNGGADLSRRIGALLQTLLAKLHDEEQVRGVTVFRGISGFGQPGVMHASRLLDLSFDLPLEVEFFDTPAKVEDILSHLKTILPPGHVVSWQAHVCDA
jgi:uncharacterized protein